VIPVIFQKTSTPFARLLPVPAERLIDVVKTPAPSLGEVEKLMEEVRGISAMPMLGRKPE